MIDRVDRQQVIPHIYVWTHERGLVPVDIGADVIAFSYQKSLTAAAGSWSITVQPRHRGDRHGRLGQPADFYRSLRPKTLVSLGYRTPGGLCYGLTGGASEGTHFAGRRVGQQVTISGRDIGEVLERDHVVRAAVTANESTKFRASIRSALGDRHPLADELLGIWGLPGTDGDTSPTFYNKSVGDVVTWLLERVPSMTVPALADAVGGAGRVSDYLDTSRVLDSWNANRVFRDSLHQFTGNLFSFLWSVVDRDFYEMWVDFLPVANTALPQATLMFRPKPFDEPPFWAPVTDDPGITWQGLRTLLDGREHHVIPQERVTQHQLGIRDDDVFSYYLVTSAYELIGNPAGINGGLIYPLVDTWAARRYGMKAYQTELVLTTGATGKVTGDEDTAAQVGPVIRDKRNRVFNWLRPSAVFETGTVSLDEGERIRVGDPLFLPWRRDSVGGQLGMRYYITGASWSWSYGGPFRCTLQLSRGHNRGTLKALTQMIKDESPADLPAGFVAVG